MELNPHASISEFFHEALHGALHNQRVETSEFTEFYLVNLLSEFATARLDDAPLALKLSAAATALPEERARCLRGVADQSLYVSGFFADSLSRGLVDVDYYIQIGGGAYHQLSRMTSRGMTEVYDELSKKFGQLVEVLAEVSCSTRPSDRGVIELYQRWRRTGAEWIARKLRARGVLPDPGGIQ
jgi:hypothetical protein